MNPAIVGFAAGRDLQQQHDTIRDVAALIGGDVLSIHTQRRIHRGSQWEHLQNAIRATAGVSGRPAYLLISKITGRTKLGLKRNLDFLRLLVDAQVPKIIGETAADLFNPEMTTAERAAVLPRIAADHHQQLVNVHFAALQWTLRQSDRKTKEMKRRKSEGEKFGRNLNDDLRQKAYRAKRIAATKAYEHIRPIITKLRNEKLTLREIADRLNQAGYKTRQGHKWNHAQVSRILKNTRTEKGD